MISKKKKKKKKKKTIQISLIYILLIADSITGARGNRQHDTINKRLFNLNSFFFDFVGAKKKKKKKKREDINKDLNPQDGNFSVVFQT